MKRSLGQSSVRPMSNRAPNLIVDFESSPSANELGNSTGVTAAHSVQITFDRLLERTRCDASKFNRQFESTILIKFRQ